MIKHNIEEEAKLMALPEGTSVTVEGITGKLTKTYPAGYENNKVVLEYMGEMDEDLLMILMKQLEIHLMNSLNFTESTVEDLLKIKVCCIQKAYVNRDLRI
jgi:putative cell wall-binding protein